MSNPIIDPTTPEGPVHPPVTQSALDAVDVVLDNHDALFAKAYSDSDVRSKLLSLASLIIAKFG